MPDGGRKQSGTGSEQAGSYEVGYGKPPEKTRFKKGQPSPNPSGRRGKAVSGSVIDKVLQRKVSLHLDGRQQKVSVGEALVLSLADKAMRGDMAATREVLRFQERADARRAADAARAKAVQNPVAPEIDENSDLDVVGSENWIIDRFTAMATTAGVVEKELTALGLVYRADTILCISNRFLDILSNHFDDSELAGLKMLSLKREAEHKAKNHPNINRFMKNWGMELLLEDKWKEIVAAGLPSPLD